MRTVPATWIEGPKGCIEVSKRYSDDRPYAVVDPTSETVVFRTTNRHEAIGWAKCYVGITADSMNLCNHRCKQGKHCGGCGCEGCGYTA